MTQSEGTVVDFATAKKQVVKKNGTPAKTIVVKNSPTKKAARKTPDINGAKVLDDVSTFVKRFLVLPNEESLTAYVLWIAHTHIAYQGTRTPRLFATSAEAGSAKTMVLEIIEALAPPSVRFSDVTVAALRNYVGHKILLIDETENLFTGNGASNKELRSLINNGYRKGSKTGRQDGATENFAPVALAGLDGTLADTTLSRCVVLRMHPLRKGESVETWEEHLHSEAAEILKEKLSVWANSVEKDVNRPVKSIQLPGELRGRDAEIWRPLVGLADAAGGKWPKLARKACEALYMAAKGRTEESIGVRLLRDIRIVFDKKAGRKKVRPDRLATEDLLEELLTLKESPWTRINKGLPLSAQTLSWHLQRYGVQSTRLHIKGQTKTVRGYKLAAFEDSWERYLKKEKD